MEGLLYGGIEREGGSCKARRHRPWRVPGAGGRPRVAAGRPPPTATVTSLERRSNHHQGPLLWTSTEWERIFESMTHIAISLIHGLLTASNLTSFTQDCHVYIRCIDDEAVFLVCTYVDVPIYICVGGRVGRVHARKVKLNRRRGTYSSARSAAAGGTVEPPSPDGLTATMVSVAAATPAPSRSATFVRISYSLGG